MRIFAAILALILLLFVVSACSIQSVPAGYVGVKVNLYGTGKGVDQQEVGPGRYWLWWNEELYTFPTFSQNVCWTGGEDESCGSPNDESIPFQTVEGMTVDADIGITYNVDPTKVPVLFQKFRLGISEITDGYLRNMIRDSMVTAASVQPIESVYGVGKASLIKAVEASVRQQVAPFGIQVERIYWYGELRLPESVQAAITAKLQAVQIAAQRQNEVAQAKAEADKKIETARGEAESIRLVAIAEAERNRILAESVTPTLVRYEAIKKWTGDVPKMTGTGSPIPFIDVTESSK